jgi:transglutaminase-like putative cysteine protease/predicted glutamine amidotransferase
VPNLLAMSFEGELAPSFTLHCLESGRTLPDGWGLGYYPAGEPSAAILKEPAPPTSSMRSQLALAWEQVASSLFLLHIRHATWGALSDANTQPFSRTWGRRDWLVAHAGSLDQRLTDVAGPFEPVGSTDTEQLFCQLLNRCVEKNWRSLAEADLGTVIGWISEFNEHGGMTMCLTDGRDLLVHADRRGQPLWFGELLPPYGRIEFGDSDLGVDLTKRGAKSRKGIIISTEPLEAREGDAAQALNWRQLEPGQVLVIREGAVIAAGSSGGAVETVRRSRMPAKAEPRTYKITHKNVYTYPKTIERSQHVLRLTPVHDRFQDVLSHKLNISVPAASREYEDVFGNQTNRIVVESPFTELILESESIVKVLDTNPLGYGQLKVKSTIPLAWMPWQRQVLQPYLLPPELPETQLEELFQYAMTFVRRNDFDLLDTLVDINTSIHREYKYTPGATTLFTTPFEVYVNRRGVCQDFTNVFIAMARLLGVPARYVCGYVWTRRDTPNPSQSEASHAWIQLYLPQVGWKGFDPTNGTLTQTEHVRVAVGRNYTDATPTSGTIFVGDTAGETLKVDVRVEPLE